MVLIVPNLCIEVHFIHCCLHHQELVFVFTVNVSSRNLIETYQYKRILLVLEIRVNISALENYCS